MNLENHISNEEVLELTRKAFESNEVCELLCGEKGYSVDPPKGDWYTAANIPSDINRVLSRGIYPLYLKKRTQSLFKNFEKHLSH